MDITQDKLDRLLESEAGLEVSDKLIQAWIDLEEKLDDPPTNMHWTPVCLSVEDQTDGSCLVEIGGKLVPDA